MDYFRTALSSALLAFFIACLLPGYDSHVRTRKGNRHGYVAVSHGLYLGSGHGYGGSHNVFTFGTNKTVLCLRKNGVCAATASCIGKRLFVCDNTATVCCLNTTLTGGFSIQKVIYPYGFSSRTRRRHRTGNRRRYYWK